MSINAPQIVAMGGGGFSMDPDNLLLDEFLLGLTDRNRPRICFVGTASDDSEEYRERFYKAFSTLPCEPSYLALSGPNRHPDLRRFVLSQDIIYVGGGNTLKMLAEWREHGLDEILREAWESEIVLAGVSAGSHCWFESGLTDSIPGKLTPFEGLGFMKGSNCVHYDGEAERRPAYKEAVRTGMLIEGLAADDGVALHFIEDYLFQVVSSRPNARAYKVQVASRGKVDETEIRPDFLGKVLRS